MNDKTTCYIHAFLRYIHTRKEHTKQANEGSQIFISLDSKIGRLFRKREIKKQGEEGWEADGRSNCERNGKLGK